MKLLKITVCLFLTVVLFLCETPFALADNDITVKINGEKIEFDVKPQLINDRTMVPLKTIFEALGANVDWDEKTKTVTSTKNDTIISLTIGSSTMYVNGQAITLDSPVCLKNGRTLVPVRAISEAFGLDVTWDSTTSTVLINSVNAYRKLANTIIENGEEVLNGFFVIEFDSIRLTYTATRYYSPEKWTICWKEDEQYSFVLNLYEGINTASYELVERNDSGPSNTLLKGSFEKDSITNNMESIPCEDWCYESKRVEMATRMLKSSLSKFSEVLPEIKLSDLGFANYSVKNKESVVYREAFAEINSIESYISGGLYTEAIELCNRILKKTDVSPLDVSRIKVLMSKAQELYNEVKKEEDKVKAAEMACLLTDVNKDKMYQECQRRIKVQLKYPSMAKFNSTSFSTQADGICVVIKFEAANAYGVYSNGIAYFIFDESLSVKDQNVMVF